VSREENGILLLLCECDGTPVPETEKARFFNPDYPEYRSLFLALEILDATGISIRETGDGTTGARLEIRVPSGIYRYSPYGGYTPVLQRWGSNEQIVPEEIFAQP
jgi:hypothetical protein